MALSWNLLHADVPICPLLDAKKKEVYTAVYRSQRGSLSVVMDEAVLSLQELSGRLTGRTLFTGEGSMLFRTDIDALFGDRALYAPSVALVPSAACVAEIGIGLLLSGQNTDPDILAPLYVRRPEAELAWEQRQRSRSKK
jgi:tRNA threonylcarbamoyladenosine biosynthesis protein TsaB